MYIYKFLYISTCMVLGSWPCAIEGEPYGYSTSLAFPKGKRPYKANQQKLCLSATYIYICIYIYTYTHFVEHGTMPFNVAL